MIFFEFISLPFMIIYLIAGFSDMLDGFVARRINIQSTLGSRLDTLADTVFFAVCIFRAWNYLSLESGQIIMIGIVLLIKVSTALINFVLRNSFIADVHSGINKITGLLLFLLPIALNLPVFSYCAWVMIIIALLSSADELIKVTRQ